MQMFLHYFPARRCIHFSKKDWTTFSGSEGTGNSWVNNYRGTQKFQPSFRIVCHLRNWMAVIDWTQLHVLQPSSKPLTHFPGLGSYFFCPFRSIGVFLLLAAKGSLDVSFWFQILIKCSKPSCVFLQCLDISPSKPSAFWIFAGTIS